MATSGTWSNLSEWLYYCLVHVRDARIAIHYSGTTYRERFYEQISMAFNHYAAIAPSTRSVGINATTVQNLLKEHLVANDCLLIAPYMPAIRVTPFGQARGYSWTRAVPLVIGVSVTPIVPSETAAFSLIFRYDPGAALCALPGVELSPPLVHIDAEDEEEEDEKGADGIAGALVTPIRVQEKDVVPDDDDGDNADEDATMAAFFTKCPICLEIPFPPWHTTTCGHLICTECHAALGDRKKTCSECRQQCGEKLVPQLLFAQLAVANNVRLRCRFEQCKKRIPWDMARAHNQTCVHKDMDCLCNKVPAASAMPKCTWKGPLSLLAQHLLVQHNALRLTGEDTCQFTDKNAGNYIIWPAAQVLLVVRAPYGKEYCDTSVKAISLVDHAIPIKLEVNIDAGDFKGTLEFTAFPVTHERVRRLWIPCRSKTSPFTVSVSMGEGAGTGKRTRVDVENEKEEFVIMQEEEAANAVELEMPPLKEARVEPIELDDLMII